MLKMEARRMERKERSVGDVCFNIKREGNLKNFAHRQGCYWRAVIWLMYLSCIGGKGEVDPPLGGRGTIIVPLPVKEGVHSLRLKLI